MHSISYLNCRTKLSVWKSKCSYQWIPGTWWHTLKMAWSEIVRGGSGALISWLNILGPFMPLCHLSFPIPFLISLSLIRCWPPGSTITMKQMICFQMSLLLSTWQSVIVAAVKVYISELNQTVLGILVPKPLHAIL